jgi:hypothetical protein
MVEGHKPLYKSYSTSLAVRKIQAGVRNIIIADKDGCIQLVPHPVKNPCKRDMEAGRKFRTLADKYVFAESSAQTIDLSIKSDIHARSVLRGLKRPSPKILLPDGTRTSKPEDVPEWAHLHNPDSFIGFGTGIWNLCFDDELGEIYLQDEEFDLALGGPEWRLKIEEALVTLFPDRRFERYLAPVDTPGLFELDGVDTSLLGYRRELRHPNPEGYSERDHFWDTITIAQLNGTFPSDAALVDESKPNKSLTTYLVSLFGQKEKGVERYGNELSRHTGVPTSELHFYPIGDSPTDIATGLQSNQGAGSVTMTIAAGSPLAEPILNNESEFFGRPLIGGPNHPTLPGTYSKTDIPGVLWWKGEATLPRKVILAGHTPWGEGLACTASVYETFDKYLKL